MSGNNPQRLGDLLLEANLIDEIQLRVALQEQASTGERLGSALVHLGFIDEAVLAAFLSKQADLPCVNIHGLHVPPDILALIPKELASANAVIPVRRSGDTLYLAMADPFDSAALEMASEVTGLEIMPLIAPEFRLKKSLERFYGEAAQVVEEPPERLSVELSTLVSELENAPCEEAGDKLDVLTAKIEDLTEAIRQLSELISSKLR